MKKVKFALVNDLDWIKSLIDRHRKEFSFVNRSILLKAIENSEILCIPNKGFLHFEIVMGKRRKLIVWNKLLTVKKNKKTQFIASLSADPWDLKNLKQAWQKGEDKRNPFEYIIYSPITCSSSTTSYYKNEKELSLNPNNYTQSLKKIWFDCGAYQVQQGKYSYGELLEFLSDFYIKNQWADGYVLPDIPPTSTDSKKVVEEKVQKTVFHCLDFFKKMPDYVQARAIAPVVGKTLKQINYCIESYAKLGITYIGFGSWGTCGKNKSVNLLGRESLSIFASLLLMAEQYEMKVL